MKRTIAIVSMSLLASCSDQQARYQAEAAEHSAIEALDTAQISAAQAERLEKELDDLKARVSELESRSMFW